MLIASDLETNEGFSLCSSLLDTGCLLYSLLHDIIVQNTSKLGRITRTTVKEDRFVYCVGFNEIKQKWQRVTFIETDDSNFPFRHPSFQIHTESVALFKNTLKIPLRFRASLMTLNLTLNPNQFQPIKTKS